MDKRMKYISVIALTFFLCLYILQFCSMFTALFRGRNYRVVIDYNHYNEFWIELVMMILSIPFVLSFLKYILSQGGGGCES